MACATLAAIFRLPLIGRQSGENVSEPAAALYERSLILDGNCLPPFTRNLPYSQSALDMVRNCGVNVIKMTFGGIKSNFADTIREIGFAQRMLELHQQYFTQVRLPADIERAKSEGKLGIIFSFESTDMLEGGTEKIQLFRNLGVRVMQFSYNRTSAFGAGVLEPDGGGLTPLGKEAATKMNALGVTIDLSHANAQTTVDAISISTEPVIISHAGCDAIHSHPRNKTDEQIRAVADKGGVTGIYDLCYLAASPKQPDVDDYMAHMEHALKIAGEDHVGVGSDALISPIDTSLEAMARFRENQEEREKSGLAAPEEDRLNYVSGLNTPRRIEVIADQLLKRGYSSRLTEKVIGANFVRAFSETWV
ncbi:MAG TPA: membrane dipeptidase [Candidatus Acidoferrales bacterium]|nr:membrane dipeptidase [Candidatus Acidoferrales bacterium]